jgi:hypothetical protein
MADLGPDDVTVTLALQEMDYVPQGRVRSFPMLTFGGAGKTYGAGNGISMPDKKKFGMKKEIKRVYIEQPADGYVYSFDRANHKLRIFQAANNLKFIGGITATEPVAIDGGDTLGKNAATDRTILAANAATKGGVIPGPLVEVPATHAPAATVLYLEVVGQ